MSISYEEAKYGFIFCLLGSDKPIYESFAPNLIDQKDAMEKQFSGMSDIEFAYNDYEETRTNLIENVKNILTDEDKNFLVSFEQGNPDWDNFNSKNGNGIPYAILNKHYRIFIEKFDIELIISPLLHDRYLEASIAHQ